MALIKMAYNNTKEAVLTAASFVLLYFCNFLWFCNRILVKNNRSLSQRPAIQGCSCF